MSEMNYLHTTKIGIKKFIDKSWAALNKNIGAWFHAKLMN
jgi:hypothetical protein